MVTYKFADLLKRLEGLDEWLVQTGLEPKNDRIHFAIEVLKKAHDSFELFRKSGEVTKIGNVDDFYFGIVEAFEFLEIYEQFKNEPREKLAPILKRALKGPLRPQQETPDNRDGRNITFELSLASALRANGAKVELAEPDLRLQLGGKPFLIACKRPRAAHSIRSNVRDALSQLEKALEEDVTASGIVAVSVNACLNPGTNIFTAINEEAKHRLGDHIERLIREHEGDWLKAGLHERISAVLFHIVTPAAIGDPKEQKDSLVKATYSVIIDTKKDSKSFEVIRTELPKLLPDY